MGGYSKCLFERSLRCGMRNAKREKTLVPTASASSLRDNQYERDNFNILKGKGSFFKKFDDVAQYVSINKKISRYFAPLYGNSYPKIDFRGGVGVRWG